LDSDKDSNNNETAFITTEISKSKTEDSIKVLKFKTEDLMKVLKSKTENSMVLISKTEDLMMILKFKTENSIEVSKFKTENLIKIQKSSTAQLAKGLDSNNKAFIATEKVYRAKNLNKNQWIINSRATSHCTSKCNIFDTLNKKEDSVLNTAGGY
jgi:hypothetical protein